MAQPQGRQQISVPVDRKLRAAIESVIGSNSEVSALRVFCAV
jgi:hypothetical protein